MNSHTQTQSKKEWHADAGLLTDEARKALRCLYLQVPETVARDVAQRVEAAFTGMQAARDVAVGALARIRDCGSAWTKAQMKEVAVDALASQPDAKEEPSDG